MAAEGAELLKERFGITSDNSDDTNLVQTSSSVN